VLLTRDDPLDDLAREIATQVPSNFDLAGELGLAIGQVDRRATHRVRQETEFIVALDRRSLTELAFPERSSEPSERDDRLSDASGEREALDKGGDDHRERAAEDEPIHGRERGVRELARDLDAAEPRM